MSAELRPDPWYRIFESVYAELHTTVRRYAARAIGWRLRRRVDAEDIAQSVFRTFDRRNKAGECDFDNTRSLRSYLLEIAANKVRNQAQLHGAEKRDILREVELADVPPEITDRQLSPAESAALRDEFRHLTRAFSQRDLDILERRLDGHTTPEIAEMVGCSRWTVRRVLTGFGNRWEQRHRLFRADEE